MKVSCCRKWIGPVAFWTIVAWIALVTVLVCLMIWNAVDTEWVGRVVWTATTLTMGILLICVTVYSFDNAEEARRLAERKTAPEDEAKATSQLREAMQHAKEESDR